MFSLLPRREFSLQQDVGSTSFEVSLTFPQHEVGISVNPVLPFISLVLFYPKQKMLLDLLITYYVLEELICQDK